MTDLRPALRARLASGCFLPAARDLASQLLSIQDRLHAERQRYEERAEVCASGCTAPVVTAEPEPLCALCAARMRT